MTQDMHGQGAHRDSQGKFRGGSGNPKGRPKRQRSIINPDASRDMIFDIAEYKIEATVQGVKVKLPLFQANLLTLGVKGANGDIGAAKIFVNIVNQNLSGEFSDLRTAQNSVNVAAGIAKGTDAELEAAKRAIADELLKRAQSNRTRVPSDFRKQTKRPRSNRNELQ